MMIFNSQISGGGDGNAFVVILSWDDNFGEDGGWVPDCTFAEVQAAYEAGKHITFEAAPEDWVFADAVVHFYDNTGNCEICVHDWSKWTDEPYCVFFHYFWGGNSPNWDGVYELDDEQRIIPPNFDSPSRTYTPSAQQQTDTITYDPNEGYNGIQEVEVTVEAVPAADVTPNAAESYYTDSGQRKWRVRAEVEVEDAGWIENDVLSVYRVHNAIAANTSVTPTESAQNIGGADTMMEGPVTVNAIPSSYVGSGITRRSSSDLTANGLTVNAPSGYYQSAASKTLTDQNLIASNIKKDVSIFGVTGNYEGSGGGGGTGLQIGTASATPSSASTSIQFTGLQGEPTSFYIIAKADLATGSPAKAAAVIFDGTDLHGQDVTNTSNSQASYDSGYTKSYSNGTLTVQGTAYFQAVQYVLVYTYGGNSANIGTSDVQVGSGATSITFPNIPEEPTCWAIVFKSSFSTSSGYTRTMAVVNDGTSIYGLEMGSGAQATQHWSASYSNGSLVISSQSTTQGGYFHQPGYYELVYAIGGEIEIEIESLSVTENGTYQESGKAYSPVVVNVPSGGGSANIDTKTVTASNRPTSLSFSSMKGQPKAFVLRCTSSMSRSSSSTYYYVAMMRYDGTSTTGNCWRMSNGNWTNITSGYSFTYSNGTLTVTSSGTTTTSPGCFYPGNYELVYVY